MRIEQCCLFQELEEKVEYWMEKYDKDVEAKQHELDVLKVATFFSIFDWMLC